ncbi:MAG: alcohol dehydrogenase catalytic domain-containing protein, partial [Acidimicrobiia bacterium]|nr:alcohol dehydrogenase catalytic domain-containing protein [Acidimicrobiia bacterium]
ACARGVVPGHEAVGVVRKVGDEVEGFAPGDRVIVPFTVSCGICDRCRAGLSSRCRESRLFGWGDPSGDPAPLHGAQAEAMRVPLADGTLVAVPETVSDASALLLADNFPTGWHAVARSDHTDGSLAIIGLGAVGLCAIAAAGSRGLTRIVGIDPIPQRREVAESLGAIGVAPEDVDETFDAIVESAGPPSAQVLAATIAEPGATISLISVQTAQHFAIDAVTAYDKNLTIRTGRAPVRSLLDDLLPRALAGEIRVPSDVVITHPDRPLADGPELYRSFADRTILKATFRPGI